MVLSTCRSYLSSKISSLFITLKCSGFARKPCPLDLQNISPIVNPEPLFEQPHANPENGNGVGIVRVLQGSDTVPTIATILVEHVFSFAPKSGVGKLEIRVSIFFKAFHVPMMI